ncbi:MAG TPA: BamA/TamA family outer membrane protein [Kofleriaceae bacterium]|nr:BamA/TamA family outer membrane protein [Kofleriaceae bacterium]
MGLLALVVTLALPGVARAQGGPEIIAGDDSSFGPVVMIERIEVRGNRITAPRLIERALPVRQGDVLRAGDPRLREARYKVLALGYFRSVDLRLSKGSARGRVIVTVQVVERGTVILDQLLFGNSRSTPWWVGVSATERNLLGTGVGLGLGLAYAARGAIEGADDQWAGELRVADESILGTTFGAHAGLYLRDASEPYRTSGAADDDDLAGFRAFPYRRIGGMVGFGNRVTPLTRLGIDLRAERVDAQVPAAPTRVLPDGRIVPVDLAIEPGRSRVVTLSVGFDRDTRADPVLPTRGDRLVVLAEAGHALLGSSYDFSRVLARYQHWWPVRGPGHVLSMHLLGGLVLGEPARFDLLHVSDMNRMLTPRALGMVVSTQTSRDFLGTNTEDVTYGEVGGSVGVEYSYQWFRRRRHVYGGDLFVGAGLWSLARRSELDTRDTSLYRALPIDLWFDVGLRLDTELGIFELTIANALGRVPF